MGVAAGCGLVPAWGETDAEANRYHEPAAPSKPATAAELRGRAGNPPIASTATSAAAATLTLNSLLGTAIFRDPAGVRTGNLHASHSACLLASPTIGTRQRRAP
jgi:hypothetical protein